MAREKKAQAIEALQGIFSKCTSGVLTDYQKIKTGDIDVLRRKLREAGIDYKVVKNTLARLAADGAGMEKLASLFQGPVSIICGYGDVAEPAKVLIDYIRSSKSTMKIKGGFLGDRVMTAKDVEYIARLPSKEVLISQVMAGIQSPITTLLGVLAAPMRGFTVVLQARIKQMGGA